MSADVLASASKLLRQLLRVRVVVPVLAAGLTGAVLAALLAWPYAGAGWTATGTVRLSEISGNRAAFEYNRFAAQLQQALAGAEVDRAVDAVVGDGAAVTGVTMRRLANASRVTLTTTASDEDTARAALLTAGRTAYREVVDAERRRFQADEQFAQERLAVATGELERLRLEAEAQGVEGAASPLFRQLDQAVTLAVADLSSARVGRAVADAVDAGLERSNAVTVDVVEQRPVALELARVALGGAVAGVALGAGVVWSRDRRRRTARA